MAPQPTDASSRPSKAKPAGITARPTKRAAEGIIDRSPMKKPKTNARAEPAAKHKALPHHQQKHGNHGNFKPESQSNSRNFKRGKVMDTRSIATQKSDAALKDGELNVQSFIESRVFQMKALDESMRRTRVTKSTRAFQRVPISLRRRSAAHNHKRVPKRLHRRAKKEMIEDNTPIVNSRTRKPKTTRSRLRAQAAHKIDALRRRKKLRILAKSGVGQEAIAVKTTRPKIRRNEVNGHAIIATKYRKRQLHKAWLPTHLWHAKRAKMTDPKAPLWSYTVPLTPSNKSYRPTHRAQFSEGAVAWDMSYINTISLNGPMNSVRNVLKGLGLVNEKIWGDRGRRWTSGAVHWTGMLNVNKQGVQHYIAPATILWNPLEATISAEPAKDLRQLFIRVHPSAFVETFHELQRLAKMQNPRPYIEDLKHQIGSIDITGPNSTEALLSILKPYSFASGLEAHATKFQSLAGLSDTAALPLGTLLEFSISDPRLHYPPKRAILPILTDTKAKMTLSDTIATFQHDEPLKASKLFDRDARHEASQLPSQKSLSRRKGKGPPGIPLKPTKADPSIPIILLASRSPANATSPGSWTVMLPLKCVLPVWYCLMHCPLSSPIERCPRFGGVDEARQLALERGQPWFPGDFPGTAAGNTWELEQRERRHKRWERLPKSKRANYETLDLGAGRRGEIGDGWSCDYEALFGLKPAVEMTEKPSNPSDDGPEPASLNTQPPKESNMRLLSQTKYLPKIAFKSYQDPDSEPVPRYSLVTVRITMMNKGTPSTCARIYRLPDLAKIQKPSAQAEVPATQPPLQETGGNGLPSNLREQWLEQRPRKGPHGKPSSSHGGVVAIPKDANIETRKRLIAQSLIAPPPPSATVETMNGHPVCPVEDDLMGFVTTGAFNLRDGKSEGIGSLSADKVLAEMRKAKGDEESKLCIVRNAGEPIGWLARWELA